MIDNRVRRREPCERYVDSVAGRMRYFKPDRRAPIPEAKAEQRAADLDAARGCRPVRHRGPRSAKSPRTRRRRPRPLGARETPPTAAAGRTGNGGGRAAPPLSSRDAGTRPPSRWRPVPTTESLQVGATPLSEAAEVTRAPAPARLRTCACIRSRCAQLPCAAPTQPGPRRRGSWARPAEEPELQLE